MFYLSEDMETTLIISKPSDFENTSNFQKLPQI